MSIRKLSRLKQTLITLFLYGLCVPPWGLGQEERAAPRSKPEPGSRAEWNQTIDSKSGPPAREAATRPIAGPAGDQEIAAMKYAEFQNGIDLARLGEQKAYHESVRQFAAKLVRDYRDANGRLKSLAAEPPGPPAVDSAARSERTRRARPEITDPRDAIVPQPTFSPRIGGGSQDPSTSPRAKSDAQDRYNRETVNRGGETDRDPDRIGEITDFEAGRDPLEVAARRGALNWFLLHKQIGQQSLKRIEKELAAQEEDDFDNAFMEAQIAAHQKLLDADQVYLSYVSSDHRTLVEEHLQMEKSHLAEARKILARIQSRPPALQKSAF